MESQTDNTLVSKNLDHLGIVAGICEEIGLIDKIDELTHSDSQRKVSIGEAIYVMILNGLGFSNRTLYLTPEFLKDKPVELLMGRDLHPKDFNDDSLGRALDSCYQHGLERIFFCISSHAIAKYKIEVKSRHLDGTTFYVSGNKYNKEYGVIELKQGYNKQLRHDLLQFVFQLISANKEGIPLFFKACSGNCSDKTEFPKVFKEYFAQMESASKSIENYYYVADSALYSKDNIKLLKLIKWITRVPETLTKAKKTLQESEQKTWQNFDTHKGYKYQQQVVYYAGIRQYWLVILSEEAKKRETKTLLTHIETEHCEINKTVERLEKKRFESAKEARSKYKELADTTKLKYHQIQGSKLSRHACYKPGRRKPDTKPEGYKYSIAVFVEKKTKEIETQMQKKGKFILATNEIEPKDKKNKQQTKSPVKPQDEPLAKQSTELPEESAKPQKLPVKQQVKSSESQVKTEQVTTNTEETEKREFEPIKSKLTPDEILKKYKNDQQQVERGFRFLKDPLFLLDHIYLKLPRRIEALAMIMALCLLVHTLAQFKLRKLLKEQDETLPNQINKQIQNPTMRWIYQLFQGIHVVYIPTHEGIKKTATNIGEVQGKIIRIFGSAIGNFYSV